MSRSYPLELIESARDFGYKAANLLYLDEAIKEFAHDNPGDFPLKIPTILPIASSSLTYHLDQYALFTNELGITQTWRDLWSDFCMTQGDNREHISEEAERKLSFLRDLIVKCFNENPLAIEGLTPESVFMVRSSSNEDRVDVANPGGNESLPSKTEQLSSSVGEVIASYFTPKSLNQRLKSGEDITAELPLTACLIQKMIGEDASLGMQPPVSGVVYTDGDHIRIQSAPGHGELVVNSAGNFDSYYIDPGDLVFSEVRDKDFRFIPHFDATENRMKLVRMDNDLSKATSPSIDEQVAIRIAKFSRFIEKKYGMRMDIEFVYDPNLDIINIVQARPIPEGKRIGKAPNALSPQLITAMKPPVIKAGVITPDILNTRVISDKSEILICNTIEDALDIYLHSRGNNIKAVIIAKEAPDTSHPAGMFTSEAIPVMHVSNLTKAKEWVDNLLNAPIIIDPQHNALYQVRGFDDGMIKEGLFKSTLSPHVTAIKRKVKPSEDQYHEVKSLLKSFTPERHYSSLKELTDDLDELSLPLFGSEQTLNKNRLAHILSMAAKAAKSKKISVELFQNLMLTGNEMLLLLNRIERLEAIEPQDKDRLLQHYLNMHQKFSGLIQTQSEKGVLSDSLIRDVSRFKHFKEYEVIIRRESLTLEQQGLFLELMNLKKYFINDDDKEKWQRFCLDNIKTNAVILTGLIKDITKIGAHSFWLNVIFVEHYNKNPLTALRELKITFDSGSADRNKLINASKIINEIEHKKIEWADPKKFTQLMENLLKSMDDLNELMKLDKRNPLNYQIALQQLYKLVDSFDLSIKALQQSSLYEDKTQQVENFKLMIGAFLELMNKWVDISSVEDMLLRVGKLSSLFTSLATSSSHRSLLPSEDFSVLQANLYQVSTIEFNRSLKHVKTFADFHTLVHQALISSISYHSRTLIPLVYSIVPEEMKHLQSTIQSARKRNELLIEVNEDILYITDKIRVQMISSTIEYPCVKTQYNVVLNEHSARIELSHDYVHGTNKIQYSFTGEGIEGEENRWFEISNHTQLLVSTLINTVKITNSFASNKLFNIEFELPADLSQGKKIIDLMHLMQISTFDTIDIFHSDFSPEGTLTKEIAMQTGIILTYFRMTDNQRIFDIEKINELKQFLTHNRDNHFILKYQMLFAYNLVTLEELKGFNEETEKEFLSKLLDSSKIAHLEETEKSTLLQNAVSSNNLLLIEAILSGPAKPENLKEALFNSLSTPDNLIIVELLIKAGANPNCRDAFGNSFLYQAKTAKMDSLVDLLIRYGASPDVAKLSDAVAFLESDNDVSFLSDESKRELFLGLVICRKDIALSKMLKNGYDVNTIIQNGYSLLHYAAQNHSLGLFKLAISNGANINSVDATGKTVLNYAIDFDEYLMARECIKNGSSMEYISHKDKQKLISMFLVEHYYDLIEHILQSSYDINLPFKNSRSLLHYAVNINDSELIKIALKHHANLDLVDNFGKTPLNYAVSSNNYSVAAQFIESGCQINYLSEIQQKELLMNLMKNRFYNASAKILENGFDVNSYFSDHRTLLHYSLKRGDSEFLDLLLRKGANPNSQDADGNTALHLAIKDIAEVHRDPYYKKTKDIVLKQKLSSIEKLLQAGADPFVLNNRGDSLMALAMTTHDGKMSELSELLARYMRSEEISPAESLLNAAKIAASALSKAVVDGKKYILSGQRGDSKDIRLDSKIVDKSPKARG